MFWVILFSIIGLIIGIIVSSEFDDVTPMILITLMGLLIGAGIGANHKCEVLEDTTTYSKLIVVNGYYVSPDGNCVTENNEFYDVNSIPYKEGDLTKTPYIEIHIYKEVKTKYGFAKNTKDLKVVLEIPEDMESK